MTGRSGRARWRRACGAVLALLLAAVFPASARAEEPVPAPAGSVSAAFSSGTDRVVSRYSVTVDWSQPGVLAYKAGDTVYAWNTEALRYEADTSAGGWTVRDARVVITVTNRSDKDMLARFGDPVPVAGVTIRGEYDRRELRLGNAAPDDYRDLQREQTVAPSDTVTYRILGVTGEISQAGTIAVIPITITPVEAP